MVFAGNLGPRKVGKGTGRTEEGDAHREARKNSKGEGGLVGMGWEKMGRGAPVMRRPRPLDPSDSLEAKELKKGEGQKVQDEGGGAHFPVEIKRAVRILKGGETEKRAT